MNMHRATLVPVKEADWSEKHEIGRDEAELIEAAIIHYKEHLERMGYELRSESKSWERRNDQPRSSTAYAAAYNLGSKLSKLRQLEDQIAASHSIRIIPDEDQ